MPREAAVPEQAAKTKKREMGSLRHERSTLRRGWDTHAHARTQWHVRTMVMPSPLISLIVARAQQAGALLSIKYSTFAQQKQEAVGAGVRHQGRSGKTISFLLFLLLFGGGVGGAIVIVWPWLLLCGGEAAVKRGQRARARLTSTCWFWNGRRSSWGGVMRTWPSGTVSGWRQL